MSASAVLVQRPATPPQHALLVFENHFVVGSVWSSSKQTSSPCLTSRSQWKHFPRLLFSASTWAYLGAVILAFRFL